MKTFSFILFITFSTLLLNCSQSKSKADEYASVSAKEVSAEAVASTDEVVEDADIPKAANEANPSKIIKTAQLRFESADITQTVQTVQTLLKKYKGSIQNDISGNEIGYTYRNISLRVPNAAFDPFINELSKGIKYFDRKEISAQDVTEEYVDIEARIHAKKILEKRYLELLSKAHKVSEMLEIEQQLAVIREDIESQEGRLRYLANQVVMSTITMEIYTPNPEGTGSTMSYGNKMWNAIASGFNGISQFFINILYIWPVLVLLTIVVIVLRRKLRKRKEKIS